MEVVLTLVGWEEVADFSDEVPEGLICSGSAFSDQSFQLGKGHLDWVQIRGIGRQEEDLVALCCKQRLDSLRFMRRQVVGDEADQKMIRV